MNFPAADNPFSPPSEETENAEEWGDGEIVVAMQCARFPWLQPRNKYLIVFWWALEFYVCFFQKIAKKLRLGNGPSVDHTLAVEFDRLRVETPSGGTLYFDRSEAAQVLRFPEESSTGGMPFPRVRLTLPGVKTPLLLLLLFANALPQRTGLRRLRCWTENLDETETAALLKSQRKFNAGSQVGSIQLLIACAVLMLHFAAAWALGLTRMPTRQATFFGNAHNQMTALIYAHMMLLMFCVFFVGTVRNRTRFLPLIFYNLLLCVILLAETFSAAGLGLPLEAGDPFIYAILIYATLLPTPFFLLVYLWYFLTAPRNSATAGHGSLGFETPERKDTA